jgi:C-terminal processing protease CtpA/Prc
MVIQLDSIRGSILQNLDSLRVHIGKIGTDSLGQVSISILKAPPKQGDEPVNFTFQFPRPDTLTSEGEFFFQRFTPLPFETFVVETEQTDSVRQELQRIRRSLTEVRRAELTRIREIQAGSAQNADELIRQDQRVRELRTQEEHLVQQQAKTTQDLQRMTDDLMRQRVAEIQEEQFEAMTRLQESQAAMAERPGNRQEAAQREAERAVRELYESRRPTSHVVVGQSFVAGAQLTPLNPALGEYFKVDQGVLVTEVLEGTPADNAGLQAGDVIVRVGSEEVASLEDLRFAVAYLDRPLRFRVIRKGNPVEIVIGK